MSRTIEVKFADVRGLVTKAYPTAKSRRTVKIEPTSYYRVSDYWDGGSRDYSMFVKLSTGEVMSAQGIPDHMRQKFANPFNLPICDVRLSSDTVIIEHTIFCGKDMGYRIHVHPEVFEKLTGETAAHMLRNPEELLASLPSYSEVPQLPEASL